MISADALLTTQYRDHSKRDRQCLFRPCERADRAAEGLVQQARCLCRRNDGDHVEERSAQRCGRCGSVRPCMTAPAAATTIVACGPSSSSAVKSITKDGGMVAQSFAVDCCTARAEVSIAARIRPENSSVRSGCGQPARHPKEHTAPIAMTAIVTTTAWREKSREAAGLWTLVNPEGRAMPWPTIGRKLNAYQSKV